MATVLKTPPLRAPVQTCQPPFSLSSPKPFSVSFRHRTTKSVSTRFVSSHFSRFPSFRFAKFIALAGEAETAETEDPQVQDVTDGAVGAEDTAGGKDDGGASNDDSVGAVETSSSAVVLSLKSFKEALESNDEARISEIEAFLKSIEDEKNDLEKKVTALSEELSVEKDRILRISADFDNFRKRTERERLSLVTNAQGEVVENLLSVLDNFERARAQIKVETEGEEKINNSYQSIYKQFMEILGSLRVEPVEPVGSAFDPLLHEAIMREESTEFEEGIVMEEFRKGYKLGDRLLRPSMVKVSAGPGPEKPDQVEPSAEAEGSTEEVENQGETNEENVEAEA